MDGPSASGPRELVGPLRASRRVAAGILVLSVAVAGWYLAIRGAPQRGGGAAPSALAREDRLPGRMHVAEVLPTDTMFREPARVFDRGTACWRIAIRDARGRPVPAARVQVDVVAPDGAVRGRPTVTTGSDGFALFTYPFEEGEVDGVYTVRVGHVSHAERRDIQYDPAANTAWSASFSVSSGARTRPSRAARPAATPRRLHEP